MSSYFLKMTQIQQISARRDLIILFRICILIGVLMTVSIPPVIVLLIYLFTTVDMYHGAQRNFNGLS
jgi:hypothetical protein